MKRSAANSWPRVTLDAGHPNGFKSACSQGGSFVVDLVGIQVVVHKVRISQFLEALSSRQSQYGCIEK